MNTARKAGAGAGTQTATIAFGGSPNLTSTESYNGTAWALAPSLAAGNMYGGGAGTSVLALKTGGPPSVVTTEEYTSAATTRSVDTT